MGSEQVEIIQVLVVDDSENDVLMIRDAFEKINMVNILDVVSDGEEALDYMYKRGPFKDKKTPGLILLDINMPKKNGFEVLDVLKADETLKAIPVVVLTTSQLETDIIQSYKKGACSYISKPIDTAAFFKVIKDFSIYWAIVSKIPRNNPSLG